MSIQKELEELRIRLRTEEAKRKEAEQQLALLTRNTTLPEFLDACHSHLFLGLVVQKDKHSSTKGDPANAERKLRPNYIREWQNFPEEQEAIWTALMDADFSTERHFTPLFALEETGKELREKSLSSELDLGFFERQTVEMRVASVIKQLHASSRLRDIFHLEGDIAFENHANTLTSDASIVSDLGSMSLEQSGPRRSGRLAAKLEGTRPSATTLSDTHRKRKPQKHPRPKADQFCVYNKGPAAKVPAFIIEYKAPHKLPLAHIKTGLVDMDLERIVRFQEAETPSIVCKRVVAAVITQAFSYMVTGGMEFGYVCTGEAFIFLQVKQDDPSTVYYFLSVPKEDAGESTGWQSDQDGDNRLHLTALGQALAFTLRALKTTPRNNGWIRWAEGRLHKWEMVYDDILGEVEEMDLPVSDFKPSPHSRNTYCRMSPVRTRSRAVLPSVSSCNPVQNTTPRDSDEDPGDDFPNDTPSRSPRQPRVDTAASSSRRAASTVSRDSEAKGMSRKYCTQRCLRGLILQEPLDPTCPNASDHGVNRHRLSKAALLRLLSDQISRDCLVPDAQIGCESLHVHGTAGALFKVTLFSHGYTFLGKGAPLELIAASKHEASIYDLLAEIQGTHVPVLLGGLDIHCSLYYDGIVKIAHLLLMSYSGINIETAIRRCPERRGLLVRKAESSLRAVQKSGILHSDPGPDNILWNSETDQVMFIDFERATVPERGMPLVPISPNRKRKRQSDSVKSRNAPLCRYDREVRVMKKYLLL